MYFIRRAFATLWEMDSAFHKLNMLKEFKNRKRSLDRKRLKTWGAAVAFFSRTKKFINSQRNTYGGHITDDLARFVLNRSSRPMNRRGPWRGMLLDAVQHAAHATQILADAYIMPAFGWGR